jgi:excisionase family DNA binding protein
MSERMLTTEEAAARLEVTTARVRQMIIAGRLPAQRFGRSHMILESDLALVEGRKTGRPPKSAPATQKPATGQSRASNGDATGKKKSGKKVV